MLESNVSVITAFAIYLLAMLLIQTNGYEIIRGHLRHVLKVKGGAAG